MARFNYTVQDGKGATSTGILEATDENEAIGALQSKGYFILSIALDRSDAGGKGPGGGSQAKVPERELVFFAEQLATLLNGGVPLVRSLSLLGEHSNSKGLHFAVTQVTRDVAGGSALYKALEKQPVVFDNLWISLVQAGELGGQLPKVLKQIGRYLEAQAELKSKIVTALAYPAVLFCMSMGVLAFFVIKIVPTFADIFKGFNITLPPLTQAVIMVSDLLVNHMPLILFTAIGVWFIWSAYTTTEAGKMAKWDLIFGIPFFGSFIRNILIERLLTSFSTLIESGVSILNAISVLEGMFSGNIVYEKALRAVRSDVAGGKSLSAAFKQTGLLPPLVTEMMLMGEESGKLPDMLSTLSGFFQEQIDQFTRRFTAIIDPILVVGIGGLVGVIVLAVFLPIFKLSTLGGGR